MIHESTRKGNEKLGILNSLFDPTTRAGEGPPGGISPACESQTMTLRRWGDFRLLHSLGVLRTAMFAEPAVTEIEEMVGLVQG